MDPASVWLEHDLHGDDEQPDAATGKCRREASGSGQPGPGSGVDAFFSRPAKGGAEAVDKNDVPDSARGCAAALSAVAGCAHV